MNLIMRAFNQPSRPWGGDLVTVVGVCCMNVAPRSQDLGETRTDLVFGCCIGPSGKFSTVAEPALSEVMAPEDVLVREQGSDGIRADYNRVLAHARELDDCEGVVPCTTTSP